MHIDFELPVGLRVAQPCRYCFYSQARKWGFRPAGATRCPDKRLSRQNVGIQPQNCQNFEFWPEICTPGATRLQYFYEILSVCTRL